MKKIRATLLLLSCAFSQVASAAPFDDICIKNVEFTTPANGKSGNYLQGKGTMCFTNLDCQPGVGQCQASFKLEGSDAFSIVHHTFSNCGLFSCDVNKKDPLPLDNGRQLILKTSGMVEPSVYRVLGTENVLGEAKIQAHPATRLKVTEQVESKKPAMMQDSKLSVVVGDGANPNEQEQPSATPASSSAENVESASTSTNAAQGYMGSALSYATPTNVAIGAVVVAAGVTWYKWDSIKNFFHHYFVEVPKAQRAAK